MIDESRAARRPGKRGPEVRCRVGARPGGPAGAGGAGGGAVRTADLGTVAGLEITISRVRGETAVAAVTGEIDLHTADTLRTRLIKLHGSGFRRLVVDFAAVPFCDAAGLGALVAAHNQISGSGGEILLARVRPAQLRLLRITGLHRLFPLHTDIEDAIGEAGTAAASPRW